MLFTAPQYNEFSKKFDVCIEIPYADGLGFDTVRRIDEALFVKNRNVFGHSSTRFGNLWWWHFLLPGIADLKKMLGPKRLEETMDGDVTGSKDPETWGRIFCAVLDVTMMGVIDDRWITNNELWGDMESTGGEPSKPLLTWHAKP